MKRDFRGRPLRCPTPLAYPDKRAPGGTRYEKCRRNSCPPCFMEKVLTLISAMRLYPLTQAGVATLLDHNIDHVAGAKQLRTGVNAAFRFIKKETGILVPRAGIVEISDAGRVHEHVVTRGPDVPSALFAAGAERAGLGFAALQPVRSNEALSSYLYKSVLPEYGGDFIVGGGAVEEFLSLNAGRVINTHGPFWMDVDGAVLDNAREARKAAFHEWIIRSRIKDRLAKGDR